MDPEIKKALANIRRRQAEINRKYGRVEDEGPIFGKRRDRLRLQEEALEDLEDQIDEAL